jgi:hypothetical protein
LRSRRPQAGQPPCRISGHWLKPMGMRALGQERTSRRIRPMSALPPKADIVHSGENVRFVPTTEMLGH